MKKIICILFIFGFTISDHLIAQKILLKIGTLTGKNGEEVKAVEFGTNAATSWSAGGGASVGKPQIGNVLIKKTRGNSSNDIQKKLLTGSAFANPIILEYYDASDVLYFTITLKNAFVTEFSWLSAECPTCIKLEHQIGFVPKSFETYDVATGVTLKYDVPTGVATTTP